MKVAEIRYVTEDASMSWKILEICDIFWRQRIILFGTARHPQVFAVRLVYPSRAGLLDMFEHLTEQWKVRVEYIPNTGVIVDAMAKTWRNQVRRRFPLCRFVERTAPTHMKS